MNSSVFALVLSWSALLLGPALVGASRRAKSLVAWIDGFVIGSVGTLAVFFILPRAAERAGGLAFAAAAAGLVMLAVLERFGGIQHAKAHTFGLVLAMFALAAHAVTDGVALIDVGHGAHLAGAVVVHRLPVAVALWWMVRPTYGVRAGILALAVVGSATTTGFFLGEDALRSLDGQGLALFESFVIGALAHVVLHSSSPFQSMGTKRAVDRVVASVGAVVGVLVVTLIPDGDHAHGAGLANGVHVDGVHVDGVHVDGVHVDGAHVEQLVNGFFDRFAGLAFESAPALLLGFFLAGLVVTFLPKAQIRWLGNGSSLLQALKGSAFGMPIPVCSCGVVPLYQSLIQKGAPPFAAIAFLIATPEIGVESVMLSFPLLGVELTITRLLAAFVLAVVTALVVGNVAKKKPPTLVHDADTSDLPLSARLKSALRYGFVDVPADTVAWILVGLVVASAVEPQGLTALFQGLPPGADLLFATTLGLPLYVCASGATPIAAALLVAGLSPGAALAFLLTGPATNVTTFGVLSQLHGRRVAIVFAGTVLGIGIVLGALTNAILGGPIPLSVPTGHEHGPSVIEWISVILVGAVAVTTLFRQGPRGFLSPILSLAGLGHSHDDDDGHDHSHHDHAHHDHAHSHVDACCAPTKAPVSPKKRPSVMTAPTKTSSLMPGATFRKSSSSDPSLSDSSSSDSSSSDPSSSDRETP